MDYFNIQYYKMNTVKVCKKCNIEKECPYGKIYCRNCQNEFSKEYKKNNKEKIKEYNKEYKLKNKEKTKEYNRVYNISNRETIQKKQTENSRKRRKNDINYKLTINMRNRMKKFFKNKSRKHEYIGCSLDLFKLWISYQFEQDMDFSNYGKTWHLDHIIPCSLFNFDNECEKYFCFNWSNYRPLYSHDNLSRQNKLTFKDIFFNEIKAKSFILRNKSSKLEIHNFDKLKYINA